MTGAIRMRRVCVRRGRSAGDANARADGAVPSCGPWAPLRQKVRLCRGRRRDVEDTVNALVAVMLMTSLLAGFTDAMT